MAMRKGLGKGKGKGYYNIINKDKKVHSDSAKGKKQPQKTMELNSRKNGYKNLINRKDKEDIRSIVEKDMEVGEVNDVQISDKYLKVFVDGNELSSDSIRKIEEKGYRLLSSNSFYESGIIYYFELQ